jgi:hypothetical protein
MKRKRNINFGFLPARPTRADLLKSRREFKANVRGRRIELRAEYARLRKSARSGRTQSTRKLEQLFHEVYGREENPRILPEMTGEQLAAIERLIEGKAMAQKKKRKKKMPAGLKAYWAKKRAQKAKRKNPRRRKSNPKVRIRTRTVIKYRYRTRKPKAKRAPRHRSNPVRRAKRINLKGFTAAQIKRVASAIRRATGKRVRVVKP